MYSTYILVYFLSNFDRFFMDKTRETTLRTNFLAKIAQNDRFFSKITVICPWNSSKISRYLFLFLQRNMYIITTVENPKTYLCPLHLVLLCNSFTHLIPTFQTVSQLIIWHLKRRFFIQYLKDLIFLYEHFVFKLKLNCHV